MTLPASLAAKLPPATSHHIPGRGPIAVWDTGDPPAGRGEPPLVLLHGWNVDAGLNFANALDHLRDRYRVVMFDQRGHGQGFRGGTFALDRCVDDTLSVLDVMGVRRFVPVGYSMGGAIAQLLARHRRAETAGLVVAASASAFTHTVVAHPAVRVTTGVRDPTTLGGKTPWQIRKAFAKRARLFLTIPMAGQVCWIPVVARPCVWL